MCCSVLQCVGMFMYTGWRRPIGCLIFTGHFQQKSPIICGSLAENDMQLEASYGSSQPCTHELVTCTHRNIDVCVRMCTHMNIDVCVHMCTHMIIDVCVHT